MDMHTFHKLSDKVFDSLTEKLEAELEEGAFDVAETSEVDYSVSDSFLMNSSLTIIQSQAFLPYRLINSVHT